MHLTMETPLCPKPITEKKPDCRTDKECRTEFSYQYTTKEVKYASSRLTVTQHLSCQLKACQSPGISYLNCHGIVKEQKMVWARQSMVVGLSQFWNALYGKRLVKIKTALERLHSRAKGLEFLNIWDSTVNPTSLSKIVSCFTTPIQ